MSIIDNIIMSILLKDKDLIDNSARGKISLIILLVRIVARIF